MELEVTFLPGILSGGEFVDDHLQGRHAIANIGAALGPSVFKDHQPRRRPTVQKSLSEA